MSLFGCLAHDMPSATCPWNTPGNSLDLELLCKQLLFWSVTHHCTGVYYTIRKRDSTMQHVQLSSRNYRDQWNCGSPDKQTTYYITEGCQLDNNFIGTLNSLSPKGHKTFSGLSRNRTGALKISASAWSEFMATHSSVQSGALISTEWSMFLNDAAKQRCSSIFMHVSPHISGEWCSPYIREWHLSWT